MLLSRTSQGFEGIRHRHVYYVVDWEEMKDLQWLILSLKYLIRIRPKIMIFAALYNYVANHGFKYVLTGSNYSTECVREPNEWVHVNDIKQTGYIVNMEPDR